MQDNHKRIAVDIAAILVSIAALTVSVFSLQYSKQSAQTAVAQIRPQLEINCYGLKQKGDNIIGTISIKNIGQTTAIVNELRIIVDDSGIYYPYFKGAIIYKNDSRQAEITIPVIIDFQDHKYNFIDQIKKDGGLQIEPHYKCMEMQNVEFSDSIVLEWYPSK